MWVAWVVCGGVARDGLDAAVAWEVALGLGWVGNEWARVRLGGWGESWVWHRVLKTSYTFGCEETHFGDVLETCLEMCNVRLLGLRKSNVHK